MTIEHKVIEEINQATTLQELEHVRSHYLGIGSKLNEEFKKIGNLSTMSERTNLNETLVKVRMNIAKLIEEKRIEIQQNCFLK